LRAIVSEIIGGMTQTTVKKENGARLLTPLLLNVDAQPIGRGTTAPVSKRYTCRFSTIAGSNFEVMRGHDQPSEFARPKEQPLRQTELGKPPLQERIWQAKDNGCRGEQGDAADCGAQAAPRRHKLRYAPNAGAR
jgi:hypothetical protein